MAADETDLGHLDSKAGNHHGISLAGIDINRLNRGRNRLNIGPYLLVQPIG